MISKLINVGEGVTERGAGVGVVPCHAAYLFIINNA